MSGEKDGLPDLDDLDAVLNFESKAFAELMSGINEVMVLEDKPVVASHV